jgi:hypothetical protein
MTDRKGNVNDICRAAMESQKRKNLNCERKLGTTLWRRWLKHGFTGSFEAYYLL